MTEPIAERRKSTNNELNLKENQNIVKVACKMQCENTTLVS